MPGSENRVHTLSLFRYAGYFEGGEGHRYRSPRTTMPRPTDICSTGGVEIVDTDEREEFG